METIGKVKYIGKSFGVASLTNGKVYDVIEIDKPFLRIIDDSGEGYLYSIIQPSSMEKPNEEFGKWELIETENEELKKMLSTQ